jgi:hypothetical protein
MNSSRGFKVCVFHAQRVPPLRVGQDNKDFAAGRMMFRNRWHFVCGTYDGENIRVYVDGLPGAATRLKSATLDNDGRGLHSFMSLLVT